MHSIMRPVFITLLISLFALPVAARYPVPKQITDNEPIPEAVTSTAAIPKREPLDRSKKYRSWTLFLICNHDWLLPENNDKVNDLYNQFVAFGRAIGSDHLAAWFWKTQPPDEEPLGDYLDVDRMGTLCKKYGAEPSAGPHIVVTDRYPERDRQGRHLGTISFNGKDANQITESLARLTDAIAAEDYSAYRRNSDGFWQALYSTVRTVILRLPETLGDITLKTPGLEVEVSQGQK